VGATKAQESEVVSPTATTVGGQVHTEDVELAPSPGTIRRQAVKNSVALPTDGFWKDLAQCETANDWQNGGRYAGGLGIMNNSSFPKSAMGTWERFGGEEFAPSPDKATREQQIAVAERIGFTGWSVTVTRDKEYAKKIGVPQVYQWVQKAVGLTGWGCYKSKSTGKYRMAKPKLYYYEVPSDVPLFQFSMGEKSHAVHDLQTLIGGLKVDGVYGKKTRQAHVSYLRKHKLSTSGVPPLTKKKTGGSVSIQSVSHNGVVKACPKWEKLMKKYGLPVKDFTYIAWRESRCQPKAIGWNYKSGMGHWSCKLAPASIYKKCKAVKSYDSGLLQINSSWVTVTAQVCGSKWGDLTVLLDPNCNLKVASFLYKEGGGISNWKATSSRQ
jgi:hypothetical protein